MANYFRLKGATISTTALETLITVRGSSNFIVGSVVICNRAPTTDSHITLSLYDDSESSSFNILKNESFLRENSKEVLSRPFIMEIGDELRVQCDDADVFDILISYLDRDRD